MFVLPLRADRPFLRRPYLTVTLIVLNVAIHFWGMFLPPVETWSVPGMEGMHGQTVEAPRLAWEYGLWGSRPTLLTFFTHMFIHGDVMHLGGNMLFLWIFGSLIEDALRPWGLAAVYLGGGILAALAHIGVAHAFGNSVDGPMVGASGAIAAIMGLFMLRFYKTKIEIFYIFRFRAGKTWVASIWLLLAWVGIEILQGLIDSGLLEGSGGTAHWAHVGGFFAGVIAAPFTGTFAAAKREFVTEDPEENVAHLRRSEDVGGAERALQKDPGNAYLMRELAQKYLEAGDAERATHTYQRCVYRFGCRKMVEQAVQAYLELVSFNERPVVPADIHLSIAQHLEGTRLPQAVEAYRVLVDQHPTTPEAEYALLRLSGIYQGQYNRPYDALKCLNQFVQRYPHSQWGAQAQQARDELDAQLRLGY